MGLPPDQYTQYYFLQVDYALDDKTWSLDEQIYERLGEKEKTMLEAIDQGILEAGMVDSADLNLLFKGLFN